jgi:hypothetical protein
VETLKESQEERAARKAQRQAAKRRLTEQRQLQRQQEAEAKRDAKRRERGALIARAYDNYCLVRDWARRVSSAENVGFPLTPSEQRIAAALAPLWDASPEAISTLRRWTEPITGVRPADYDNPSRDLALGLKYAVATLRRHAGVELFVQELPLLGGFGVEWHRQYYNADTVRYFKALVALQDGGVLGDCRGERRRLVWEIGGGWGGLAFQFKTVCPNVTYLITGMPELLLVSAVYLMTAFPAARCRFYGESSDNGLWHEWEQVDFVFAPDCTAADLHPPALDMMLDVMVLDSTSSERLALYVDRAADLGARYFFSQLPGPCFPEAIPRVWRAIERRFWLHQVPPPLDASAFFVEDLNQAPVIDDYAQAIGWRRLRN